MALKTPPVHHQNKDPFPKSFDIGKIGTGKYFTSGKNYSRRAGLWGALRSFKGSGRRTYAANLSAKDLEKFHGLIGDELKKMPTDSNVLSYKAKRRIMYKANKMAKEGEISFTDKKDLKKIINTLSSSGRPVEIVKPEIKRESGSDTLRPSIRANNILQNNLNIKQIKKKSAENIKQVIDNAGQEVLAKALPKTQPEEEEDELDLPID